MGVVPICPWTAVSPRCRGVLQHCAAGMWPSETLAGDVEPYGGPAVPGLVDELLGDFYETRNFKEPIESDVTDSLSSRLFPSKKEGRLLMQGIAYYVVRHSSVFHPFSSFPCSGP